MAWRGGRQLSGQSNYRSSLTESSSPGVQILFAMVHNGKHLLFQLTQVSAEVHITDPGSAWQRLLELSWETSNLSGNANTTDDREGMRQRPQPHNQREPPQPGGVIKARNKPGPGSGYIINANAMSPYLEGRADWAWNVTGTWRVDSPGLAERIGCEGAMVLTIFMENGSKRQKTGRQLWGIFDFSVLHGNMRLCPGSPAEFGVIDQANHSRLPAP